MKPAISVIRVAVLSLISAFGCGCSALAGWLAPDDALTFPERPMHTDKDGDRYDVDGDGAVDFLLALGADGRMDVLRYDDDQDGVFDRTYRRSDYDPATLPHLILLVDSLPYRAVAGRYAQGRSRWFHPPAKVIPPFPSLSEVIFTAMLHAPPFAANIERYYERRTGRIENLWISRAFGYQHPWQRRLDAHLESYLDVGLSYLNPRPWFQAELARSKHALDVADRSVVSGRQTALAYIVSSSAMLSRYGTEGLDVCLDGVDRLCLQLLYERQGAVQLTVVSDHGHNLTASTNFPVAEVLREAGFEPTDAIRDRERDVVPEINGLVTYFGVHTARARRVAEVFASRPEIELVAFLENETVVVRDGDGEAGIERRGNRYRYRAVSGDPLEYDAVTTHLRSADLVDSDGFIADRDWLSATADHRFPDGPRRLWDATHGQVVNPPQVFCTLRDGRCAGLPAMEAWIDMRSTHGGLNQINSDAVLLTTVAPIQGPLRTREVIGAVEPRLSIELDR